MLSSRTPHTQTVTCKREEQELKEKEKRNVKRRFVCFLHRIQIVLMLSSGLLWKCIFSRRNWRIFSVGFQNWSLLVTKIKIIASIQFSAVNSNERKCATGTASWFSLLSFSSIHPFRLLVRFEIEQPNKKYISICIGAHSYWFHRKHTQNWVHTWNVASMRRIIIFTLMNFRNAIWSMKLFWLRIRVENVAQKHNHKLYFTMLNRQLKYDFMATTYSLILATRNRIYAVKRDYDCNAVLVRAKDIRARQQMAKESRKSKDAIAFFDHSRLFMILHALFRAFRLATFSYYDFVVVRQISFAGKFFTQQKSIWCDAAVRETTLFSNSNQKKSSSQPKNYWFSWLRHFSMIIILQLQTIFCWTHPFHIISSTILSHWTLSICHDAKMLFVKPRIDSKKKRNGICCFVFGQKTTWNIKLKLSEVLVVTPAHASLAHLKPITTSKPKEKYKIATRKRKYRTKKVEWQYNWNVSDNTIDENEWMAHRQDKLRIGNWHNLPFEWTQLTI